MSAKKDSGFFTLDDLVELSGTIQVPSLKEGIVDEDFASDIEEKLYQKGHTCKFVSLDDMGFISISFFDSKVTDERLLLVLDILNNRSHISKKNKIIKNMKTQTELLTLLIELSGGRKVFLEKTKVETSRLSEWIKEKHKMPLVKFLSLCEKCEINPKDLF